MEESNRLHVHPYRQSVRPIIKATEQAKPRQLFIMQHLNQWRHRKVILQIKAKTEKPVDAAGVTDVRERIGGGDESQL